MTNKKLIEQIEAMTMTGSGADDPRARFGYDRARGDILNLLRSEEGWATAGNTDYELHGRPADADVVAGHAEQIRQAVLPTPPHDTEINIVNAGWTPKPLSEHVPGALNLIPPANSQPNFIGALQEAAIQDRHDRRRRSW